MGGNETFSVVDNRLLKYRETALFPSDYDVQA